MKLTIMGNLGSKCQQMFGIFAFFERDLLLLRGDILLRWYLKAQQLNPKNGRPYNQLALLAHYAVRIITLGLNNLE